MQSLVKKTSFIAMLCSLAIVFATPAFADKKEQDDGSQIQPDTLYPRVEMHTNMGKFVLELNRYKAPASVNNFLKYVDKRMYDGTVFHRVESDYVIQGGGYAVDMKEKPAFGKVINESGNGLKNELYTIAMARMADPHSATRQFYFNMNDNAGLDPGRRWGYTVFGQVTEGTEILDKINLVETHYLPLMRMQHVPKEPVILGKVVLLPPL